MNNIIGLFDKSYSSSGFSHSEAIIKQKKILNELLENSKNTRFGEDHNFRNINNYEDFKSSVPIRDYEGFRGYIEKIKNGEKNVTWIDKPLYLAKTSGTTSGTKFIPITKESLPNHINTAKHLLYDYFKKKKKIKPFLGKVMFLSGTPNLDEENGIKIGRLSGIVNHHKPFFLKNRSLPSTETNQIDSWEEKINNIVEETLGQDLRVIGGIPPWIQMYFDVLIERTGKKVSEIFPNLELLCHGGVNFQPYKTNLFNSIGRAVDTLETFPASEGFFAYQDDLYSDDLLLQVNSGIFFEFVELNELKKEKPKRISIEEIKLDTNYAMVITSNAGLWSYDIGDTIKFTDTNPLKIKVSGRTKQYVSAFGEHVIVDEVEKSLKKTCEKFKDVEIVEYTVGPRIMNQKSKSHHEWFIEFKSPPSRIKDFEIELDLNMKNLNIYYRDLRKDKILSRLKITKAKKKSFINFMKSIGKLGGQNKVPRLSNNVKLIEKVKSLN
ncbi:MAG: GH3 auxin-responsive promoter family protein [Cytophagales bacterium]